MAREDCPRCRGTGWKMIARTGGISGEMAVACECGMEERAEKVMERARIPKKYKDCDFESYETELTDGKTWTSQHAQSMSEAKLTVRSFVRDYPGVDDRGLLLMGNPGVGKTHLAIAALKELVKRGHSGFFCEYGSLLREVQGTYRPDSEMSEIKILDPILNTEVLVIDDLGVIKPSDWVRDIIGYILNKRYVDGSRDLTDRRCTIITTNYFDELEANSDPVRDPSGRPVVIRRDTLSDRIGERTRSRLYEICRTVLISAPDFRRFYKGHAGRARA